MRLCIPVMASAIIGVAAGLTATPGGAQDVRSSCDGDHDRAVTADETQGCAERRFERARAGADGLAVKQVAAAPPEAEGLRRQFAQADEDGDGRISREEWLRWFGPSHAGTTEGAGSRPTGTD